MSAPLVTKDDFAKWNQTTSVFHLPKRLVGKSKVTQLRAELVKTIGEKKVSAIQALPGLKFRVCFSSPLVRSAFDINGLNFRGLNITPFPAYEEVKAVFVDRAPPQMQDKFIFDALAPYGRVISVKHFCRWVKLFYSDVESAVVINRWTSSFFRPSRGVRQGCPLSPPTIKGFPTVKSGTRMVSMVINKAIPAEL